MVYDLNRAVVSVKFVLNSNCYCVVLKKQNEKYICLMSCRRVLH
jgi:hypothetical protein